MTEAQVKLFQMYMRENQKLGAAVDTIKTITATPLNSRVIRDVANKFLIDFGIEKKGGDNEL